MSEGHSYQATVLSIQNIIIDIQYNTWDLHSKINDFCFRYLSF